MLSSWREIPNRDLVQKSLSSVCIQRLAEAAKNAPSREIMRYILEVSSQLIGHWKEACKDTMDYFEIHKLFCDKRDLTQNTAGIQILGVMVANDIAPYQSPTTVPVITYFEDFTGMIFLRNWFKSKQKQKFRF